MLHGTYVHYWRSKEPRVQPTHQRVQTLQRPQSATAARLETGEPLVHHVPHDHVSYALWVKLGRVVGHSHGLGGRPFTSRNPHHWTLGPGLLLPTEGAPTGQTPPLRRDQNSGTGRGRLWLRAQTIRGRPCQEGFCSAAQTRHADGLGKPVTGPNLHPQVLRCSLTLP